MKAMLFAAGLGTRLRPLTNDRPKALVEVAGVTLLERNLRNLFEQGCTEVVVNVHAFADQVEHFIDAMDLPSSQVLISDERTKLLETGGGLYKAKPYLGRDDFLVHNVDILSTTDLQKLFSFHKDHGAIATLCVRQRESSRYLLFDEAGLLGGWRNNKTGEERLPRSATGNRLKALAFSGIYVCSPRIFDYMPNLPMHKFSIIDTFLQAASTEKILAYPHDEDEWIDVGKPETHALAEQKFSRRF